MWIIVAAGILSCAQPRKMVKELYAFSMLPQQGAVQVDDKGNELPSATDTIYVVFAETVTDSIVWKTAWVGGRYFTITAERLNGSVQEPGLNPEDGSPVRLKPGKGHSFYRLVLQPAQAATAPAPTAAPGTILLQGGYRNKMFEKETAPIRFLTSRSVY